MCYELQGNIFITLTLKSIDDNYMMRGYTVILMFIISATITEKNHTFTIQWYKLQLGMILASKRLLSNRNSQLSD